MINYLIQTCEHQKLIFNKTFKNNYLSSFISILSCVYKNPINPVTVIFNNNEFTFNPLDIETLMIISIQEAVYKGNNNNR